MNMTALIVLIAYTAFLIGVGYWASKKSKSEDAFLLGNRGLGPVVAGIAYAASSSSAWVLLGFSGFVYAAGISALWMVPGILLGFAAVWLFAGPVLQKASRDHGNLTLTDFLVHKANSHTAKLIRISASLMVAFCFSYYVASQFQGAGIAFDDLFGTGLTFGVIIGAVIILIYTLLGGFLAVSFINTLQGLLMALVAVVLPAIAFISVGGFEGIRLAGQETEVFATTPTYFNWWGGRGGWVAGGFALGLFATGFGALGQPHLAAWVMATKDTRARVTGAGVALVWGAVVYSGMAILGVSARVILGSGEPVEGVFFAMADHLLPSAAAGLVIAATLSAIMSTVDSLLLVAGASIGHDLGLSQRISSNKVIGNRLGILIVCIIAVVITLSFPSTIFDRTLFAWVALGASFGPTVVVRALKFEPSGRAVLASIILGFSTSLIFELILSAGPGAVWARTIPWFCAMLPFVVSGWLKGVSKTSR